MTSLQLAYRAFDPFGDAFQAQIAAFNGTHPDIDVVATAWDPTDLYKHMVARGGMGAGKVDLMLTLSDWLPSLIEDKAVACLDGFLETDPPQDWPDGWSPSMRSLSVDSSSSVFGIAYHDGPMTLLYRSDLLDDQRESEAFERQHHRPLSAPETWDEFVDVARWFNRPDQGLAGASIAGFPDGHNNVYDFLVLLWSHGGELLGPDNRPRFDSPAGRAALQLYVDLVHTHMVVPLECLEHDSVASGDYFAAGRSAMMWNWSGFASVTELPTSAIRGSTRLALIPRAAPDGTHATLNVYWLMTMSSRTRHPEAAWRLMQHLASAKMDKVTAQAGGTGTRLSTWRDEDLRQKFPFYRLAEQAHKGARTLPALVCYPQVNDAIAAMTRACMHEARDIGEALRSTATEVTKILEQHGVVS